ncbi:esterase, PHB depolymerase family [Duganella sp. CF517]|uniref:extracellular catalytic domain type 1 short-chain-length polyhydroxyalkanoate depolymerase n=1 Tax=Duganella sp. CF517 TaxID=1881038 RepID=UPI0008B5F51F|nr:PHB depolymerase family esterase [Duganella sp. CF517]SEO28582.1 esterase, PHB depolymerase family [Duganella sp. CF517]
MKLPFMSSVRSAAQKLINKGATAAVQKAMESMIEMQQKQQQQRAAGPQPASPSPSAPQPSAQPPMRDINPPPEYVAPRSAPQAAADGARVHADSTAKPAAQGAAEPQPQAAPASAPNPATNPTEYAQDMLNRMGIKIDLQANMPGNFNMDFGSMMNPAPAAALPEGAQFISGSYANHAGSRNYKLYVPSTYTGQAMPLLVMLHGCTQNPDDFAAGTQMNQVAEEMGCFVAYPEQTSGANHSKCWNWFNAIDQQHGQGEPSIIAGIAQQIIDEYPVNERQVYIAGLSAGGAMAVIVGTLYPELFAAVGVHSGLPFASAQDLPSALSAMKRGASSSRKAGNGSQPIIVFHGDSDTTVNPRNGEQVIEQSLHSHQGAPSIQSGSVPNGHRYTQTTHTKADGSPLGEHWVVHGAGHAWSGGSAHGTYTDAKGPDASREMVRFFRTVS